MLIEIKFKKFGKREEEFMERLVEQTNDMIKVVLDEVASKPFSFLAKKQIETLKATLRAFWFKEKGKVYFGSTVGSKGFMAKRFVDKTVNSLKNMLREEGIEYEYVKVIK